MPYKGSAPALTDLIGGHVQIYFSSLPPAVGLVKDGKVIALAVTGAARSPIFPDVPTVAEAGLPGYEAVLHYGIVAPAGTPRPVVDKLNAEINKVVARADVKEAWAKQGAVPMSMSPAEFDRYLRADIEKWAQVVKVSGAKVN